jgi:hypothetical protein
LRKMSLIRSADDLIDEATKRLAAIERALEALQRRRRRWSTLAPAAQMELREQIDYVQARRARPAWKIVAEAADGREAVAKARDRAGCCHSRLRQAQLERRRNNAKNSREPAKH